MAEKKSDYQIFKHEGRSYIEIAELRKVLIDRTWKVAIIFAGLNFISALFVWLLTENATAAALPIINAVLLFLVISFLNNLSRDKKTDMA